MRASSSVCALLVLLAVAVIASGKPLKVKAAPKVAVNMYIESYCPDCMDTIVDQLYPAYTNGLADIMDLALFPYGNAKEAKNGSEWAFTCQHGVKECQGNLIETCAIHYYPDTATHFPFIYCLENSGDPVGSFKQCASQNKLNYTTINACATGKEGNSLEHDMAVATDALSPAHEWVPWITINGKHNEDADSYPVSYICDAYTGSKPKACNQPKPKKIKHLKHH